MLFIFILLGGDFMEENKKEIIEEVADNNATEAVLAKPEILSSNDEAIESNTEEVLSEEIASTSEEIKVDDNTVLEISNFSFVINRNQKKTIFNNILINKGDFFLIKGKNGSGKSTFLKYLNNNFYDGVYSTFDGSINFYDGNKKTDTTAANDKTMAYLRKRIVEIKQLDESETWVSPYASIYDQAYYGLPKDLAEDKRNEKLKKLEELVIQFFSGFKLDNGDTLALKEILGGISEKDFKRKKLSSFSGGQRKMVQIISGFIKAIITETPLMIIDEPANNLDGKNKYYLNQLFKFLRKENKDLAIVMISHCHVFDDINRIITIDLDRENRNQFFASVLKKENANAEDLKKFNPHTDCIELCENLTEIIDTN